MTSMEPGSRRLRSYAKILNAFTYGLIAVSLAFAITSDPPRWAALTIGALAIAMAVAGVPVTNGYAVETKRLDGVTTERKASRAKAVTYTRLGMLVVAGMGCAIMFTA